MEMLSIPCLLTAILVLNTSIYAQEPPEELDPEALFSIPKQLWKCGSMLGKDLDASRLAIHLLRDNCPEHAVLFNHCCVVHDDCYVNQRGRETCDAHLSECAHNVLLKHPNASQCSAFPSLAISSVQKLSWASYEAAIDFSTKPLTEMHLPNITKIKSEYTNLYKNCLQQNFTLASCALNYDLCRLGSAKCALSLLKCLDDTGREREHSESCDEAITMVISKLTDLDKNKQNSTTEYSIINEEAAAEMIQYVVNQIVFLRSPSADGAFFIMIIVGALAILACVVACLDCAVDKRVAFDDLGLSESELVSE